MLTEFRDWLLENNYIICERDVSRITIDKLSGRSVSEWPHRPLDNGEYRALCAQFFDIDMNKVEEERRALIEELRKESEKVA